MKKKVLSSAVLVAMTLSCASVFAAPDFSGDAKIQYDKANGAARNLMNEIRLNADADLGSGITVHGRLVADNNVNDGSLNSVSVKGDQLYFGGKINNLDMRIGRQPLFLGQGLLADENGINGIQLAADVSGTKIMGFYGNDNIGLTNTGVSAIDFATSSGKVNFGASYLNQGSKYYALNANTKITDNAVVSVEYAKNDTSNQSGYIANVKFKDAVKKGDFDYSIGYRDIDAGAVNKDYSTYYNINDTKGVRIGADYKVTDKAMLSVFQDFAKDHNDNNKDYTQAKFAVTF